MIPILLFNNQTILIDRPDGEREELSTERASPPVANKMSEDEIEQGANPGAQGQRRPQEA